MAISKKLGHIKDYAVFDGSTKISEHASLAAAQKKRRENQMGWHVRQWNSQVRSWQMVNTRS